MKIYFVFLGFAILLEIIYCIYPIYRINLFEELQINEANGGYFIGLPVLEDDSMSANIRVSKPYDRYDLKLFAKGYYSLIPSDEEITEYSSYILLNDYNLFHYPDYDIYTYPFSTIENVGYLAFYFETNLNLNLIISIKSEKKSPKVYHIQPLQENSIEEANGDYFFGMPIYGYDKMSFEIKFSSSYDIKDFDFSVAVNGFKQKIFDEEMIDISDYIPLKDYQLNKGQDYYICSYPFESIKEVNYLGIYFSTESDFNVTINIKTDNPIYIQNLDILEYAVIKKAFGHYYYLLPSFENETMAFDIKIRKPIKSYNFDFKLSYKGFGKEPSDKELIESKGYSSLTKYKNFKYDEYDLYSYSFSKKNDVEYYGFHFHT